MSEPRETLTVDVLTRTLVAQGCDITYPAQQYAKLAERLEREAARLREEVELISLRYDDMRRHWQRACEEVERLKGELAEEKKLSAAISRDCNDTALERNAERAAREEAEKDRDEAVSWIRVVGEELEARGDRMVILATLRDKLKRIAEALDYLSDYEDVRDGYDGRQMPNTYMEVGMILRGEGP